MNVKILYEDKHIIVCVKPAGMPSQAERSSSMDLVSWLKNYLSKKEGNVRKGVPYVSVVHRLDRPVGGIMVYAKTKKAAEVLSQQFANHQTEKKYLTVLTGSVSNPEGTLEHMLLKDGEKMSKSRGNVINPDVMVKEYGADTLRLYEMFMGPLEATKDWTEEGIEGARRFLDRVWRLLIDEDGNVRDRITTFNDGKLDIVYNQTVKKITEDYENLQFNTAVAQLMVFVNDAYKVDGLPVDYVKGFIQLLAPVAPHLGEELWHRITGSTEGISYVTWPTFDEAKLVSDEIEVVFQINGKVRGKAQTARSISKEDLEKIALENKNIQEHLEGLTVRKVIVVPGKLVNIVAN